MSYQEALKAAGAEVIDFAYFGSCRGNWIAKIRWEDRVVWVHGSYGSCSGCDAFEAEMGYLKRDCEKHRWMGDPDCRDCIRILGEYQKSLASFGRHYLNAYLTQEEMEKVAEENAERSWEDGMVLKYIRSNPIEE